MFLFMESCRVYNHADENFVSRSTPDVQVILSSLNNYCHISLKWFNNKGMNDNPAKFKFMIMSLELV